MLPVEQEAYMRRVVVVKRHWLAYPRHAFKVHASTLLEHVRMLISIVRLRLRLMLVKYL